MVAAQIRDCISGEIANENKQRQKNGGSFESAKSFHARISSRKKRANVKGKYSLGYS